MERPVPLVLVETGDPGEWTDAPGPADTGNPAGEGLRATCPECGQRILLTSGPGLLPVHALCPTPWNPFGLTVCGGTGRPVPEDIGEAAEDGETLTEVFPTALPEGLDWRLQPFSHRGGPGARPVRPSVVPRAA
ncbi:hypothetical protein FOE67_06920 [Streptomyces calidiresistens]|uniref:Uncharacterized protein n=2 Tax=Streptomyces calidiresistens TaxID=1485586 RepID=A0A7W3T1M0_9ACTN|nr:hypothetical protein [Streptomyces calidiresistens]